MARKIRISSRRCKSAPPVSARLLVWNACIRSCVIRIVLVPLVLLLLVPKISAQQPGDPGTGDHDITQPWITISPPVVAEDDPRNETLALVIADNLELTLRLIGEYVVRPRPTERTAPTDAASAAVYAAREEVDYVVFGEVSERADGSTEFSLFVYSRETGTVTLERRAVAETVFDTFEVADQLAAEVLGVFTGQRIAYGRVELANLGEAGAEYQVLVDGTVIGRNLISVDRVLVGERLVEVEVLTGPQAGEVVVSRRLVVEEGARERLEFTALAPLPVPEPEELLVEVPEEQAEEPETETEIAAAPAEVPESEQQSEIPEETDAQARFVHRLIDDDAGWIVAVPEVQIAGGTVAVGGYNIGLLRRRIQLSLLAGLGWAHGPKVAAAQRLTWAMTTRRVVPRFSIYASQATDFEKVALSAGPSFGLEV